MSDNKVRCIRCAGSGEMYKLGNGYCQTNMGGEKVTCPLCNGAKVIKPLTDKEVKPNEQKKRPSRAKKEDSKKAAH